MRAVVAIAIFTLLSSAALAQQVLNQMPAKGSLRQGQVVLVDDGSCPKGKIKQVIGGSSKKHIRRRVRCIQRR